MITEQQRDLARMLQLLNIAKMPKEWQKEKSKKIWVDAILEVRKSDCSISYAYAFNNYGKEPIYKKVVGNAAMIVEVIAVYPLHYLGQNFLPNFQSRDEIVSYICDYYQAPRESVDGKSDDDLKTLVYSAAIERHSVALKSEQDAEK